MLETSHPPTYYLPRNAFAEGVLRPTARSSWCEWKGPASYYDVVTAEREAPGAAWTYLQPSRDFAPIAGAIAVMAAAVDLCTVNGEEVIPKPGGFYGGWITSWIVGPFKGIPGSAVGDTRAPAGEAITNRSPSRRCGADRRRTPTDRRGPTAEPRWPPRVITDRLHPMMRCGHAGHLPGPMSAWFELGHHKRHRKPQRCLHAAGDV